MKLSASSIYIPRPQRPAPKTDTSAVQRPLQFSGGKPEPAKPTYWQSVVSSVSTFFKKIWDYITSWFSPKKTDPKSSKEQSETYSDTSWDSDDSDSEDGAPQHTVAATRAKSPIAADMELLELGGSSPRSHEGSPRYRHTVISPSPVAEAQRKKVTQEEPTAPTEASPTILSRLLESSSQSHGSGAATPPSALIRAKSL